MIDVYRFSERLMAMDDATWVRHANPWSVYTRFAYNRLLGDAADSPVVDDVGSADQYAFGGGVFYRF